VKHRILIAAWMVTPLAACGTEGGAPTSLSNDPSDFDGWLVDDDQDADAHEPTAEAPVDAPPTDGCDGRDNDWDGLVDEDFAPGSCVTEIGEAGELACLGAVVRCAVCVPGEVSESDCGCGVVTRVDTCDERGRWVEGPCDGCPDPKRVPCGFCGHVGEGGTCIDAGDCQPGDSMIRRCDACPSEEGCGAHSCVGEKVKCNNQCQWDVIEPCDVRQPLCNRDEVRQEKCGECGTVDVSCDGCFWTYGRECDEKGECFRGVSASVPCGSCGQDYRAATASCNSQCEWAESSCRGCQPGGPYTREHGCACSGATHTEQYYCELRDAPNSCGVGIGIETDHTWLNDCPPVPCYPGQTDTSGDQCRHCDDDCQWSTWTYCGPGDTNPPGDTGGCGCTEGATRTVSCPSLCNYTTTETCRSCNWVRSPCPPCNT
jgi:hypothetical protein